MTSLRKCFQSQWSTKELLLTIGFFIFIAVVLMADAASANEIGHDHPPSRRAAVNPSFGHVVRVLTLQDYNTRVVLLGTVLLGISGGIVGTFMLMRRRSLVGDVVGHTALPGIAVAFLVMEAISPGQGRWFPGLMMGAFIASLLGLVLTTLIRKYSRIREDAAMAIVLSIFFGFGIALFTIIQNIPTGNAAGLNHFIFGKAASLVAADVKFIGWSSLAVLVMSLLLFKEFALLCFDEDFATTQGWPVLILDLSLMLMVVTVGIVGVQSVGLLLVAAMFIIPAVAARFWSDRLLWMTIISAVLGGVSAALGVIASALVPRLSAGAIIVLMGTFFFVLSLILGTRRGVLRRWLIQLHLRRKTARLDLMRACYEYLEPLIIKANGRAASLMTKQTLEFNRLLGMRTWSRRRFNLALKLAGDADLIYSLSPTKFRLTETGANEARRVVRNHRLWELYLIHYADVAPSHVDRDADTIEHVLSADLITELNLLLAERFPHMTVPPSPHAIDPHIIESTEEPAASAVDP